MTEPVVTRFAPSPTGYLHIGGARTALFNWLFARANGGKMLLRIEDTDRARSTDDAIRAIIEGMAWLGLDPDEEPVSQFSRGDRHREIAKELLARGKAYKCFATQEELEAMREQARAEGKPPRYDGRWRDRPESDAPAGTPYVVRIKAPQDGDTWVKDKVQGDVRFPNKDLDDFVILRSDGSPTYMLAVVVDDHDMKVSHIIRGDDHLTNAARQTLIFNAMDWKVPVMAHIPLIHGADGAKLSKRHGALGVEAYRAMGYLPEALKNYLVRLGWAHGDEEIISEENMISWFGFGGMNKAAARFDFAKLENLNGHYIRHADDRYLLDQLVSAAHDIPDQIEGIGRFADLSDNQESQLMEIMHGLKERAKTLVELTSATDFLFANRPLTMDEKAAKLLDEDARKMLGRLGEALDAVQVWSLEAIEETIRTFADNEELKLGKVAQPLRAALTGTTISPGVFDVAKVLGKQEAISRIQDVSA